MLTKDELETPRTAAEMLAWVYSAHERFRATKELRAAAREGKFFAKELIHEALPIALFAHRYYGASHDVIITHVIGNQKYDAVVDDRRGAPSPVRHIEATVSDWSYMEALRMELLSREGHAPVTAKFAPRVRSANAQSWRPISRQLTTMTFENSTSRA